MTLHTNLLLLDSAVVLTPPLLLILMQLELSLLRIVLCLIVLLNVLMRLLICAPVWAERSFLQVGLVWLFDVKFMEVIEHISSIFPVIPIKAFTCIMIILWTIIPGIHLVLRRRNFELLFFLRATGSLVVEDALAHILLISIIMPLVTVVPNRGRICT